MADHDSSHDSDNVSNHSVESTSHETNVQVDLKSSVEPEVPEPLPHHPAAAGPRAPSDPRLRPMNVAEEKALAEFRGRIDDFLATHSNINAAVAANGDDSKIPLQKDTSQSYAFDVGDDACLLRFLRARQLNVDKAYAMWTKWMDWKKTYRADTIIAQSVSHDLSSRKVYWFGHDKEHHPTVYIVPRRHDPEARRSMNEFIRFGIWNVEHGIRIAQHQGVSQFVVVYDRCGMAAKNRDRSLFTMARSLINMYQCFYAERLHRCYILNANWLYHAAFKIVSAFLSKETKDKICICSTSEEFPLLQYFDRDQLQKRYGGTNDFRFDPRVILGPPPQPGDELVGFNEADIHVKAGQRHELQLHLTAAMLQVQQNAEQDEIKSQDDELQNLCLHGRRAPILLTWEFTSAGDNIDFSISFEPDGHQNAHSTDDADTSEDESTTMHVGQQWIVDPKRVCASDSDSDDPITDSVACNEAGVYTLIWDNKFSYFRSKKVSFHAAFVVANYDSDDTPLSDLSDSESE
jgi:CRAL/TRIO domain/CRAL/TRIO, N-terminal domain